MSAPKIKNVSRETEQVLRDYVALIEKWNAKINLIGKTTEAEIWERHIDDSLQLSSLIPSEAKTLCDMGSGAGLPGIILAIAHPQLHVTLAEHDDRKAAFLREAIRVCALANVEVYNGDVADLKKPFDVVTARAFAPLVKMLSYTMHLIHNRSLCLFPKGESYAMELAEAKKQWVFHCQLHHSTTQEKSMIVSITELKSLGGKL